MKQAYSRVDAATEKAIVPILTLGANSKSELDDQSWIGCLTGVSKECKYDGCVHVSTWQAIVQILKMISDRKSV